MSKYYPVVDLPYPPSNNVYYRHSGNGSYISADGLKFKKYAGFLARAAGVECLQGEVEVILILHPRRNKDGSASKSRLDLDNCLKAVFDSMIGVGYEDDKQVIRLIAEIGTPVPDGGVTLQIKDVAKRV